MGSAAVRQSTTLGTLPSGVKAVGLDFLIYKMGTILLTSEGKVPKVEEVNSLNLHLLFLAAAEEGRTIPEGIVKRVNIQLSKSYSFLKAQLFYHLLCEVRSESPQ